MNGCGCVMPPPMSESAPVLELRDVQKDYRTLRTLRVRALDLHEGESLALLGFDRAAAEVLVNLITAATVPDAGEVRIFGRATADIRDPERWLTALDDFAILTERAIVLDNMTVEQIGRAHA